MFLKCIFYCQLTPAICEPQHLYFRKKNLNLFKIKSQSCSSSSPLKYTVTEPRKKAYADFYKQYDAVKEFNAMREAGVFESVRPSGE